MTALAADLAGKAAIVSGAGKGLGRAYAIKLAASGVQVLVNNRRPRELGDPNSADAVVAEILAAGGEAIANYSSVDTETAGEEMVSQALQAFGRLDIVIANAGVEKPCAFSSQSQAEFESNFTINFFGTSRLLQAAWSQLEQADDAAVLVSTSSAGLYGNHGQAGYAASKAALVGLAKSLALEGASRGIRVNALAPYAHTQMTDAYFPAGQVERFAPEAVAELAAWLVSSRCSISGETLIAGAGQVRRVRQQETAGLAVDKELARLEQVMAELMDKTCDIAPANASAEFEDFIRGLEGPSQHN